MNTDFVSGIIAGIGLTFTVLFTIAHVFYPGDLDPFTLDMQARNVYHEADTGRSMTALYNEHHICYESWGGCPSCFPRGR